MFDSLSELRLFCAIYAGGSVKAAARQLGLTPAAASKRLMTLEGRLGTRLFNRTTRSLSPTSDGDALYPQALRILSAIDDAEDALTGEAGALTGEFRFTASATFANLYLTDLISDFMRTHPGLQVTLDLTDRNVDLVAEGIDLALRHGTLPDSSLISRKIAPCRRMLCAAPSYIEAHGAPRRPQEIAEHRCLTRPHEDRWNFSRGDAEETVNPRGGFSSSFGDAVRQMALRGHGLAVLTDWHICEDLRDGQLMELLPDWTVEPDIGVYLVYPAREHLPRKTRTFMDFLAERWSPEPPWRT